MQQANLTRGRGLLEKFLAQRRAFIADRLITAKEREGRILDIGCGTIPYFLSKIKFKQKYGIDPNLKVAEFARPVDKINFYKILIQGKTRLPFDDNYFDVITLLAVVEHFTPEQIINLFSEIRRILRPEGRCIVTTPSPWSANLIRFMANIKLISFQEIVEIKASYSRKKLMHCFAAAGFNAQEMNFGYFQMFLNSFAFIEK